MESVSLSNSVGFPVLSLMVFMPLVAALAASVVASPALSRRIAILGTLVVAMIAFVVSILFDPSVAGPQMIERFAWLPSLGVDYALAVDGLSILLLPMTAILFLAIISVAPEVIAARSRWVEINLLVLLSATLGVFAAADAIMFFVFFEATLVPGYFLIKLCGGSSAASFTARRYMVVMLLGSLPVLAGLLYAGIAAQAITGELSFDIAALNSVQLPQNTQVAIFVALLIGFGIKAPALPLHLWIAPSVAAAPTSLIAWLLGVKLGTYGFLRFVIPLTPNITVEFAPYIIALEVAAVVYAGLIALSRRDLRSLLVFSSIGHVGLMTAAIFSGSEDGMRGAVMMMLNAGIATAAFAICIGLIERRTGRTDLQSLGGLITTAPKLTAVVFVSGLALIGMPGTSGFVGEILALKGVFDAGLVFGLIAVTGVVLGAAYFLSAYQKGFLGEASAVVTDVSDLRGQERWFGAGVILVVVTLGLFPGVPEGMVRASIAAQVERQAFVLDDQLAVEAQLASTNVTAVGKVSQ